MEVKTSTKEKFTVISVAASELSANMTEELCKSAGTLLQLPNKNVVLNMEGVAAMTEDAGECLVKTQHHFYESGASFEVCCLQPAVEQTLDETGLLELMNVTPTESEAWDIVQMEEIERELLGDEEE